MVYIKLGMMQQRICFAITVFVWSLLLLGFFPTVKPRVLISNESNTSNEDQDNAPKDNSPIFRQPEPEHQVMQPIHLKTASNSLTNPEQIQLPTSEAGPKTLVILIGQARGGEIAWNSLKKNVLDSLNADLAVMFTEPSQIDAWAKYRWQIPEYSDWSHAFDKFGCGDEWRILCQLPGIAFGGIQNCGENGIGSGAITLTFRAEVLRKLIENGLLAKYDNFIMSRADYVYGCMHIKPIPLDNHAWIPEGEDYGGVTDRHLMASAAVFAKAINATEVVCNPRKWYDIISQSNEQNINIELLLKLLFQDQHIPLARFPRNMFSIRKNGDLTRWSKGDHHHELTPKFGILVKYPTELELAEKTCNMTAVEMVSQF